MVSEYISTQPKAKVIVLFGGNPFRRDEVIHYLQQLGNLTIYGTLSEEEGIEKLTQLPKVDLVLIGGRYSHEQRMRIRSFIAQNLPNAKISEPGIEYPYDNAAINADIGFKLNLKP